MLGDIFVGLARLAAVALVGAIGGGAVGFLWPCSAMFCSLSQVQTGLIVGAVVPPVLLWLWMFYRESRPPPEQWDDAPVVDGGVEQDRHDGSGEHEN